MSELFINSEIYHYTTLAQTCKDFGHLASIQVEECKNGWQISFAYAKCPIDLLSAEFENYLIDLSCKKHQW